MSLTPDSLWVAESSFQFHVFSSKIDTTPSLPAMAEFVRTRIFGIIFEIISRYDTFTLNTTLGSVL